MARLGIGIGVSQRAGLPAFANSVHAFAASAVKGTAIGHLNAPFGTGTTYAIVGTAPGQLDLSGSNVVVGGTAAVAGVTYSITIRATSAVGGKTTTQTFALAALPDATIFNTLSSSPLVSTAVSGLATPLAALDTRLTTLGG